MSFDRKAGACAGAVGLACALAVFSMAATVAAADPLKPAAGGDETLVPDDETPSSGTLDKDASDNFACSQATFWRSELTKIESEAKEAKVASAAVCHPTLQDASIRKALADAANGYVSAAKDYHALRSSVPASVPAACRPPAPPPAPPAAPPEAPAAAVAPPPAKSTDKALESARGRLDEAGRKLAAAIRTVEERKGRSPASFEALVNDPAWASACTAFHESQIAGGLLVAASEKKDAKETAAAARASDILRKAPSIPSIVGGGGAFVETGGAPDRIVYSLFTSLGADEKTNGTQMLMTLNLGQILSGSEPIEQQHAWVRNLFLRTTIPLSATEEVPVVAARGEESGPNLSRMSFVLGTSLADSTDPRTADNQSCYRSVLSYVPFEPTDGESSAAKQGERKDYYDICNRQAANRQRLALRLGLGLVIEDDDAAKTSVEYVSGVAVWAPASWLYFNALYQRLLLPEKRHLFGGGFSTSMNVSGSASGVDAWARIGLDLLVLGVRDEVTRETDVETRISLTTRFKLPQSGIVTFGIGPRLLGSEIESPGLLATVGLSYDADALLEPLLGGAAAPSAGAVK